MPWATSTVFLADTPDARTVLVADPLLRAPTVYTRIGRDPVRITALGQVAIERDPLGAGLRLPDGPS